MRRGVPFALGAVALLFAGCTGSDPQPGITGGPAFPDEASLAENETVNATASLPPPQRVASYGCRFHLGAFPVPMSDAASGIPSGFEPVRFLNQSGFGLVIAAGSQCGNGTVLGAPVGELASFFFGLQVLPPEEYRDVNVTNYFLGRLVLTDPASAAVFESWNLGGPGEVALSAPIGTGGPAAGEVQASWDGTRVDLGTQIGLSRFEFDTAQRRLFGVDGSTVTHVVDLVHTGAAAYGVVESAATGTVAPLDGRSALRFESGTNPYGAAALAGLAYHQAFDGPSFEFRLNETMTRLAGGLA